MISPEFLDWSTSRGVQHPKLRAALVDEGWRGLVCTADLRAGEPLPDGEDEFVLASDL